MSDYKKPGSKAEFDRNFEQKKPVMNKTEAYYESSRCLFCYDAPCITACPTGIDIPLFIKQIHTGNVDGAAKTIYDANWFGYACGKVCPTGVLCEGACVYNLQNVKPIDIGRLQTYASDKAVKEGVPLYRPGAANGKKVAVIGAGPAGISCACELRTMGFEVDIYEAKDKPSGLTIYGTAPYKITNEEVLDEVEYLQNQLGFNIIYNHPIKTKEEIEKLEAGYDAIFLGVGLGSTRNLGIPGEELGQTVGAVEFIEELRMKQHEVDVPDRVVVIGGGNTAMDTASESARMGASFVLLAYRRSKDEMGAYGFEYDLARNSGVQSMFNVQPVEVLGNAKVTGIRFIRTKVENGKLSTVAGSEFEVGCDLIIKATGQEKMTGLYTLINGLETDASGRIVVDGDTYQTTNPKYFAGGDAINGGAEVVNAAHDGKAAAMGIETWLKTENQTK